MTPLLAQSQPLGPFEEHFVRLVDGPAGPLVAVLAVAVALAIGGVHALTPGHGKAVLAAYLVGERGRPRDALALGVVVAAMHTLSVLVLGALLHVLLRAPGGMDHLVPWMTAASGGLVLAVGVGLLVRHVRRRRDLRAAVGATAEAAVPAHHHVHDLPPGVSPLSRRGLVLLGVSGGLLPSPSAFLVLATAVFSGRTAYGVALVVAFSVGLAATLTGVGLAVLRGREVLERRALRDPRVARLTGALPLASALLVTAGGAWITVLGVLRAAG